MSDPGQVWLRLVRDEDIPALKEMAEADKHAVFMPTHVFVRVNEEGGEELIGCASVASVPLVLPYFHTQRCKARDSRYLINVMEALVGNLMNERQAYLCVPFAEGSPFEPHIARLGYASAGKFQLTFKNLKGPRPIKE